MVQRGAGGEEWRSMEGGGSFELSDEGAAVLSKAEENIDRYRKAPCTLSVVDRHGAAVANRDVTVSQVSHEFPFGDQTAPLDNMYRSNRWETDRAHAWRQRFADCLTSASVLCYWTERPENDLSKTEDVQGINRVEHFAACAEWAAAKGLHVKGHPLFWSIPKCWPSWLSRYDPETQMKFAEMRIRSLLTRFGKQVRTWDVVNEALWEPAPENLPTREWPHLEDHGRIANYVSRVLDWCREEAPENTYVLNDYGLEWDGKKQPISADGRAVSASLQRERLLDILELLDSRAALPDAIGLQSHTGGVVDPAELWKVYDQLGAGGLPIHITEFWADRKMFEELDPSGNSEGAGAEGLTAATSKPRPGRAFMNRTDRIEEIRADYIERYMTVAFSHPSIEAFNFWGFMSSSIDWSPAGSGHSVGPVYERVRHLINERWRTQVTTRTDDSGRIRFRGFPGDYTVRVGRLAERFRVSAGAENACIVRVAGAVQ